MDLPLYFERKDPGTNRARFYLLDCGVDLFGEVMVRRHWGRIGTAGRHRDMPVPDREAALGQIARLAARRLRRGYLIVG